MSSLRRCKGYVALGLTIRRAFYLATYSSVIFLDKHCFCVHKCKNTAYLFRDIPYFENYPVERSPTSTTFFIFTVYYEIAGGKQECGGGGACGVYEDIGKGGASAYA